MAAIEQFGFSLSNLKIIVINWKVCQVYIIMGDYVVHVKWMIEAQRVHLMYS